MAPIQFSPSILTAKHPFSLSTTQDNIQSCLVNGEFHCVWTPHYSIIGKLLENKRLKTFCYCTYTIFHLEYN